MSKTKAELIKHQKSRGAPGTLKAKIKGPVTIAKARALKSKPGATAHDKRQANWFINMQQGKKKNEEIATSTSSVAGAGDNPQKIVPIHVTDRRRRKDQIPRLLKRFRKHLEDG